MSGGTAARIAACSGAEDAPRRAGLRKSMACAATSISSATSRGYRSASFAEMLLDRVSEHQTLLRRSHREAGLAVLLAPDVPAVLLEMGFITSPEDEAILADPGGRGRLMSAVSDSIDAYFVQETRLASR